MKNTVSAALSRGCDNNLHEQLMSSDWLRHSTVDRRTLRPLSMVHFDPCQQPRCQARTLSSVQRTCNTQEEEEEGKKTHQTGALRGHMTASEEVRQKGKPGEDS